MEAADRAQRERVIRLNRYSQGRKDQDTIRRLRAAMKGKSNNSAAPPNGSGMQKSAATQGDNRSSVGMSYGADASMVFRSLDPSMFK